MILLGLGPQWTGPLSDCLGKRVSGLLTTLGQLGEFIHRCIPLVEGTHATVGLEFDASAELGERRRQAVPLVLREGVVFKKKSHRRHDGALDVLNPRTKSRLSDAIGMMKGDPHEIPRHRAGIDRRTPEHVPTSARGPPVDSKP